MGITRRQVLKSSLGALLTVPFIGMSSPEPVEIDAVTRPTTKLVSLAKQREEAQQRIRIRRSTRLLRRCGNAQRYDNAAMNQFGETIYKGVWNGIQFNTGLERRDVQPGLWRACWEQTDYASSVDWRLYHARDARWDIVARGLQLMEEDIVNKLNQAKVEGSFLRDFQLWPDPCLWSQGLMGFYCWAELESPYNDCVTFTETCE